MKIINEILIKQQNYKTQHSVCDTTILKNQLTLLSNTLVKYEQVIATALFEDLHKNPTEAYLLEFVPVMREIKWFIKNLNKIHAAKNTTQFKHMFMYQNYEKNKAHGNVLIYAAYNYPFQLSLIPLIGAIACNNTVILKLSENTPHINKVIGEIISSVFREDQCYVIDMAHKPDNLYDILYSLKVDMVFFTGSYRTGQKVYQNYAKQMIPVVLELGGKSPTIIDQTCNLTLAIKRLVWAKMMNCGQTCVAPDYVILHQSLLSSFIDQFKQEFVSQYNDQNIATDVALCTEEQTKICNELLKEQTILWSHPLNDKLDISLVKFSDFDAPIWKEEIFGPLLPIITYDKIEEIYPIINHNPNPLALYIFSEDKTFISNIYENVSAGSIAVNDCVMHLISPMPFGGVGKSGLGQYHGAASVRCFTRIQPLVKCTKTDFASRYAPTTDKKLKFLKKFVK